MEKLKERQNKVDTSFFTITQISINEKTHRIDFEIGLSTLDIHHSKLENALSSILEPFGRGCESNAKND